MICRQHLEQRVGKLSICEDTTLMLPTKVSRSNISPDLVTSYESVAREDIVAALGNSHIFSLTEGHVNVGSSAKCKASTMRANATRFLAKCAMSRDLSFLRILLMLQ